MKQKHNGEVDDMALRWESFLKAWVQNGFKVQVAVVELGLQF